MRHSSFLLFLALVLPLPACGGGTDPFEPLQVPPSSGIGGGGIGHVARFPTGGSGGGTTPAPQILFHDSLVDLGQPGAFPSDLAIDSAGVLFTVDTDLVPCNLLTIPTSGLHRVTRRVPITAASLVDMDGTTPARAATVFGSGLFGAFTGDITVAFGRWILVTVGAGNSASDDGSHPLRLANLLVIDTQVGAVIQTLNLAWAREGNGTFSDGGSYAAIPQSLPVNAIFLPSSDGTFSGRVFVALSNGAGDSFGLNDYFQGTVQEWRVDFEKSVPVSAETVGKGARDITRTFVSTHYNPVGLSGYVAADGRQTMILTSAGASEFDANFVVHPTTNAFLEFLDLSVRQWRPEWEVDLGRILPAASPLAHAVDGNGKHFALLTSQTFAAVYAVDLSGLEARPTDPLGLRLLRTVELAPAGSVTPGSGFQPSVATTPSGRGALVSSNTTSGLQVLALPEDIEFGVVEVDPEPFGSAGLSSAKGWGLGTVVVVPGAAAEAYFVVNGTLVPPTFAPGQPAFVGSLDTGGRLP